MDRLCGCFQIASEKSLPDGWIIHDFYHVLLIFFPDIFLSHCFWPFSWPDFAASHAQINRTTSLQAL